MSKMSELAATREQIERLGNAGAAPAKELAFTAGPVQPSTLTAFIRDIHGNALASVYGDRGYAGIDDHAVARTLLVADAFDVFNETGLTPRQLAEQRDELRAALEEAETALSGVDMSGYSMSGVLGVVRAAIAKTCGGNA